MTFRRSFASHDSNPYSNGSRIARYLEEDKRATTNVSNIDLSRSFYYLFFSSVLIELKPFVLKGKVLGENF